jgi:PAS domain S-box-containing protein
MNDKDLQHLAAIVHDSDDAIVGKTLEGIITSWNGGAERIYGYTAEEAIGRTVAMLVPPNQEDDLPKILEKLTTGAGINHYETLRVTKDGKLVNISLTVSPIRGASGNITGMSSVGRNMTQEKETEAALLESERAYKLLMEQTSDAVLVSYPDQHLIEVNERASEMFGFTREELLQIAAGGSDLPEGLNALPLLAGEILEGDTVYVERPVRRKDGTVILTELSTRGLDDGRIVTTARDITNRKNAEEALRRTEEHLRMVVSNADIILFAFDPEGTITLWRGKGLEALGIAPGATVGQSIFDVYSGQTELLDMWKRALLGEAVTGVYDFNGVILEYHLTPVPDNMGRLVGATGVAINVTEQKKAEALIQRVNEELEERVAQRTVSLEAAVKELEAFSYSVSHDLRAPLRAVSGFSNALLDSYSGQLDTDGKRYLSRIQENTAIMGQLIDDLLEFSKLNRQQMAHNRVDMDLLISSVADDLREVHPEREYSLVLGKLTAASGDRSMIRQVLINLLSNAIKFTQNNAEARIEVGSHSEGAENVYYVRDNGAGFDMQYIEKLFGVFQRLHSTKEFEGNGVGLALTQRIVQRHGGRIWAEGEVNVGATFYFTLPPVLAAQSIIPSQAPSKTPQEIPDRKIGILPVFEQVPASDLNSTSKRQHSGRVAATGAK